MKNTENKFDVLFWGDWALFTNPLTMLTGSKYSYAVPPMSAIKGMLKSIYWKPSVEWRVDSLEILNKVQRETKNVLLQADKYQAQQRGTNNYLKDVAYRVKAHLVPSAYTEQFGDDQQEGLKKHASIAHSRFAKGAGYSVPVLGTTECMAFTCETWQHPELTSESYYKGKDLCLDIMLLDLVYPVKRDENFYRIFWTPEVSDGVIHFPDTIKIVQDYCENSQSEEYIVEELDPKEYNIPWPAWLDEGKLVREDV